MPLLLMLSDDLISIFALINQSQPFIYQISPPLGLTIRNWVDSRTFRSNLGSASVQLLKKTDLAGT